MILLLMFGVLLVMAPFVRWTAVNEIIEVAKNSSVERKAVFERVVEVRTPGSIPHGGEAWSPSRPVSWASS